MAYTNPFPVSYQPAQIIYPQPPQMQIPQVNNQQNNTSIVWVQGEAGAKAYPVAAGNSVMLLDSEASVFYIKSTDASGMPMPLRTFDFVERTNQVIEQAQPKFNPNDYVSRDEFNELKNSLTYRRKEKNNGKPAE